MEQKQSVKVPGRSVAYLLMCGVGVLAFIAIGLYPSQSHLGALDMEIAKIRCQIEQHKELFPIYKGLLKRSEAKGLTVLPSPVKSTLPPDKTEEIPVILGQLAAKCNLKAISIVPDVLSLADGSGLLLVNALVKGEFFDFRKFLIELGGVPYLKHIEEIHLQKTMGGKECRLKIWLALA